MQARTYIAINQWAVRPHGLASARSRRAEILILTARVNFNP